MTRLVETRNSPSWACRTRSARRISFGNVELLADGLESIASLVELCAVFPVVGVGDLVTQVPKGRVEDESKVVGLLRREIEVHAPIVIRLRPCVTSLVVRRLSERDPARRAADASGSRGAGVTHLTLAVPGVRLMGYGK